VPFTALSDLKAFIFSGDLPSPSSTTCSTLSRSHDACVFTRVPRRITTSNHGRTAVDRLERVCTVRLCLFSSLFGDPLCPVRHSLVHEYDEKVPPSTGNVHEGLKAVIAQFYTDQLLTKCSHVSALIHAEQFAAGAGKSELCFNQVVMFARHDDATVLWWVHAKDASSAATTAYIGRGLMVTTGETAERIFPEFEGAQSFTGPVSHITVFTCCATPTLWPQPASPRWFLRPLRQAPPRLHAQRQRGGMAGSPYRSSQCCCVCALAGVAGVGHVPGNHRGDGSASITHELWNFMAATASSSTNGAAA
jgi:hypothetical protein